MKRAVTLERIGLYSIHILFVFPLQQKNLCCYVCRACAVCVAYPLASQTIAHPLFGRCVSDRMIVSVDVFVLSMYSICKYTSNNNNISNMKML